MINNGIILSKNFRNDMYKSFIVFCILFSVIGCADKNAFSKFNVSKEKEIALDNIRFAFTESEFFQREVERAVNDMIYKNNQENDKAFVWFMGG